MKIDKITYTATIPVVQYGNIVPSIEMSDVGIEEAEKFGLSYIKELFNRYSEKGEIKENEIISTGLKKSFNEDLEISFNPINHEYYYGDKKLVSATEYTKKFYKEFDTENISAAAAKSWGIEQNDVKELWKTNGEITSDFGNIVHKALEYYTKFRAMGQKISDKKELPENYALPKHPILRKIIEGFIKIEQTTGEIIPEALITLVEKEICGHADRVVITDKKKKHCDIEDFKVNINSEEISKEFKAGEPFNGLPANKLTKYQIQMSIYANMLQASGYTVDKLVVYIYEDIWRRFELPVLQVLIKKI